MDKSYPKYLEARRILGIIASGLVTEIDAITISSKSPMVYASCMEVSKYRLAELTEDALDRWEHGKYLSCCILGRSIFETVLNLEWINYQIQDFLDGKLSPEEIHKKLMLATHASRMEDSPLTSVNIMSIIQMIDKRMSNIAGHGVTTNARVYGWFSGFAHPNADGAFLLYAKINKNSLTIDLSRTMHPIPPTVAIDFIRLRLSLFELCIIISSFCPKK